MHIYFQSFNPPPPPPSFFIYIDCKNNENRLRITLKTDSNLNDIVKVELLIMSVYHFAPPVVDINHPLIGTSEISVTPWDKKVGLELLELYGQ